MNARNFSNFGATRKVTPSAPPASRFGANAPNNKPQQQTNVSNFQELPTQEGTEVEGQNMVLLQGILAYPNLSYTQSGIARFTARIYVPFISKGERKRIGYPIQAWGDIAEGLSKEVPEGQPIQIRGALNIYSWVDRNTNEKVTKTDVKVDEYYIL